ncbi:MAG: isoleucine--tRNA ligase [Armatimonadetes bacterium]|nr:isoleucine--tRNA ligase [Armatimonadota bacterium]
MDFKLTLNLPDADFTIPMKADLPVREPAIQAAWKEARLYETVQEHRKDDPLFLMHDGPPYTNGPIHIGTAFNKILKDFALKSRMVMGYRVPYVPGFDNHGLPIEQAVMKKFAEQHQTPDKVELRRACREHAARFIDLQTEQFSRLGIFGRWDKPYRTMDYRYEAGIVRVFKRLVERGYVYRGLRPTLWSPTVQTALADTEIVYKDVRSKAITVRFPLPGGLPGPLSGLTDVYAVIWTTTPWTIPANLALAFHPEYTYDVVHVDGSHYVVLHELVAKVAEKVGWTDFTTVGSLPGSAFEGLTFRHPVFERDSVGVLADYVTTEDGTGIVHTAPGHGRDDFYTGQKYGLPVLCPVDARGTMTEEAGEFAGVYYKKCDALVVSRLEEVGHLLAQEDFLHSYPHAERDDNPVIFRATEQWFVQIDHDGLRERMLRAVDDVDWFPQSGHARFRSMIEGRPDWCISRQRPWGVGIPVFYGAQSGTPVLDPVAMEAVAKLVEEKGSDAWYTDPPEAILPAGYTHPETGETEFRKETDVFDVWFDSGCTHLCVLEGDVEPEWKEPLPSDLVLEGSDQHRGWFNVSMILGMAVRGGAPYRQVVTHGWVNDEKGQKMSKRSGNVSDPVAVCDTFGADVLRYWAGTVDFEDDAPYGENLLKAAGEGYRRIRNTLRFLLGNLYDYDPNATFELQPIDRWIIDRTEELADRCLGSLKVYKYNAALSALHNFCGEEVSAFYGDSIKDRLYCDGKDWPSRRAAQHACHEVLRTLTLLSATFLPHLAEEVYEKIPGRRHASVFLDCLKPKRVEDAALAANFETLLSIRAWVYSEFEKWKAESDVRDSQAIEFALTLSAEESAALADCGDLAVLFKSAAVQVGPGERSVRFRVSDWPECARSRLRRPDVERVELDGEEVWLSARDRQVLGR